MDTRKQFQQNAGVFAANGQRLGQLERVVLDPETKVITNLVISRGSLVDKEERVLPIEMVAEATENQITLRAQASNLEAFPVFESPHYVVTGEEPQDPPSPLAVAAPNPAYGTPIVAAALDPIPTEPIPDEVVATRIDRNIPEGTVAMKEGSRVITTEGKHAGNVERILADDRAEQVTHLLISKGLLFKHKKLIPIKWVSMVGEEEIHLRVKQAAVEELADSVAEII